MSMIESIKRSILGTSNNNPVSSVYETKLPTSSEFINHKFDYPNAVPSKDAVIHLVNYCHSIYDQYLWIVKEDEKKESKDFNYQKKYRIFFDVRVKNQKHTIITCTSIEQFNAAVADGKIDSIEGMEIRLNIEYKINGIIYSNLFMILLRPFSLEFIRKSNYNQLDMNCVEDNINEILKRFNSVDSLFCPEK